MTLEEKLTQEKLDAIATAILDHALYIYKNYKTPFPMVAIKCMKDSDWELITDQPIELKDQYFKNIVQDEGENERFSEAFQKEIKIQRKSSNKKQ